MKELPARARPNNLELFAESAGLEALEASLRASSGLDRLPPLIALAWQYRQRDCSRAMSLSDEAESLLVSSTLNETEKIRAGARLKLVRAEVLWLSVKLDESELLANAAQTEFETAGDSIGIGDSLWLLAFLWFERGEKPRSEACLASALGHYREAGDETRANMAQARIIFYATFKDPKKCAADLALHFGANKKHHSSVEAWLLNALGSVARLTGNLGHGVKYSLQAYQASRESGQIRNAIITSCTVAINLTDLGDLPTALDWNDCALNLARTADWPGLVGVCLMQAGKLLLLMGQYEASGAMLKESLDVMEALKASRNYALALRHLGDLAIAVKDFQKALDWFSLLEERANALGEVDLQMPAKRGKASALSWLRRPEEAIVEVDSALTLAREQRHMDEQIQALRVWAQIHWQHRLPAPAGMLAPSPTLHYLNEAIAVAATIDGYSVSADLFDEASEAYAVLGDYREAYKMARSAAEARNKTRSTDAQNRVIAMQVRYETERLQAEAKHQSQLARKESQRAEALQQENTTLETLSKIGREITASLDREAVFGALYGNAAQILDVNFFCIYLLETDKTSLRSVFAMEDGKPLTLPPQSLHDPDSNTSRSARERKEILVDVAPERVGKNLIPGTLAMRSLLYAPLLIGERLLGVISIQSDKERAYAARECSIFRTLCSYSAIALDNAQAYAELKNANSTIQKNQQQLLISEKMASLGRLTAGIAHEMNTPIATVRAALEEQARLTEEYCESIGDASVTAKDHLEIASDMKKSLGLAKKASERAASFIRSIKNQTRESKAADKVEFDIVAGVKETLTLLDFSLRPKAVRIKISGSPGPIYICGQPGQFSQVITNLVNNSIDALPQSDGEIELIFDNNGQTCALTVKDNGQGIPAEIQSRIFDPLFTTKRFGEGTGLGLTIVRDIVMTDLNGTIELQSEVGRGAAFKLGFKTTRSM